jgi:hypothetical protein
MIMKHARVLCATSLSAKAEAEERVAEHASMFCNIDVKKIMLDTHGWRDGSAATALCTDTQMIEEDEIEYDLSTDKVEDERELQEGEDIDGDVSIFDDCDVASVDTEGEDLSVEMFSHNSDTTLECQTHRQAIATSLKSVLEQRIGKCEGKPSNIPLTSRPVERMFSGWRRLVERNSFTKASTAQAMFLLKEFKPSDVLSMLIGVPFTKAIQTYLRRLKEEDNQADLDKRIYDRTLTNTQENKTKLIQYRRLKDVAEEYGITYYLENTRKQWTRAHSLEFFHKANFELSTGEKQSTAESLKKLVFITFAREHPKKWPLACLSFECGSDTHTLTHVAHDTGTALEEDQTYDIEEILGHKLQNKSKYLVFCFILFCCIMFCIVLYDFILFCVLKKIYIYK